MFPRILALAATAFVGIGMVSGGGRINGFSPAEEEGRWNGHGSEFLEFTDGDLRGSDGCNGVAGSYVRDGDALEFRRGMSTMKACLGVDTWLRTAARARVDGDTMTVFDRDGTRIGTLTRAA